MKRIIILGAYLAGSIMLYAQHDLQMLNVPRIAPPDLFIVDGQFSENVWGETALHLEISDSIQLLISQDKKSFYIGIKSSTKQQKQFTDLFLSNDSFGKLNLHASFKLGERSFVTNSWDPKNNPWEWGNNEGWVANTINYDDSKSKDDLPMILKLANYQGQEFKIAKSKIGNKNVSLRVEVTNIDLNMNTSVIKYPKESKSLILRFN